MDLIIANDTVRNFVLSNRWDRTFKEVGSLTGLAYDTYGKARGAMGIDTARYREDEALAVGIGNFANEMTALANSWKTRFGGDPHFVYSIANKQLAPKITSPTKINGKNRAIETTEWLYSYDPETRKGKTSKELNKVIDSVIEDIYK